MNQPSGVRGASSFKKGLFMVCGTICLGVGTAGVFLPILPTTPFLLLSAACYYKGSERMHRWLLNNKLLGNYIRNYREGKGISSKGKILTLFLLWATICYSTFFLVNILMLQVILFAIAIAVTVHVTTIPTAKKSPA